MISILDTFDSFVIPTPKNEPPMPPIARLYLQVSSHDEDNDLPLISPKLMSAQEIDDHVAILKRNLDRAGQKAKGDLKRAHDKIRQWCKAREEIRVSQ